MEKTEAIKAIGAMATGDTPVMETLVKMTLDTDDLRGVLVAIAPVIGTARTMSAAGNMLRAFAVGMDLQEAVAEMDRQMDGSRARRSNRAA